jgi:hypothetical protein
LQAEFRRHNRVENPLHIVGFLGQWKLYLDHLESTQGTGAAPGRRLGPDTLEKVRLENGLGRRLRRPQLSAEQVGQLYEALQATRDLYAPQAQAQHVGEAGVSSAGGNVKR